MKFEDFEYTRPVMADFNARFDQLLTAFEAAENFENQSQILVQIDSLRTEFATMFNICHIRHTINTADNFYEQENDFFDENSPLTEALTNRYYGAILQTPFRKELEAVWGSQLFVIAELSLKTFRPEILEDMQDENRLSSEYTKLKASAKIHFDGKDYNLSSIFPVETSPDRDLRRRASAAKWSFYAEIAEKNEIIFDNLTKTRHRMAQSLGYQNYVGLGYARMLRSDYDAAKVADFRQQILQHVVPVAAALYEKQRVRLGLEKLKFYDEEFRFASGNPKPKGEPAWILKNAVQMYSELSPETKEFFDFMCQNNLMDLEAKDGKAPGGYCTYIGDHHSPYIFSNFNGTSGDIDVLTHEAGHAFQVYSSRNVGLSDYQWPTYEACEIHSMSMEFFTWKWMHLFFEEDTDKYKFAHLSGAILFLPYGVAVDEFQHFVYENPDASIAERNTAWRNIEKKYLPWRDYDGNEFLESGGYWQKQSHIFNSPFYYIDYTLAQICAFQYWSWERKNPKAAWDSYVKLCKAGGSHSFLDLVKSAGLRSPFEEGCVSEVVADIRAWLDTVKDATF